MFDRKAIVTQLRKEAERINFAADALDSKKRPARVLSAEARERIGKAQRKRWAIVRKNKAA